MTRLLLLLSTVALVPAMGQSPARVLVSGTATRLHETHPCLGGAAVTQDMIQRERTPIARQPLTVFAGDDLTGKVVARPKTDGAGRFSVRLAPGKYCVVVGEQEPLSIPDAGADPEPRPTPATPGDPHLDRDCLERLARPVRTCDAWMLVLEGAPMNVQVVLYSRNQCTQQWAHPCWRGPMPP